MARAFGSRLFPLIVIVLLVYLAGQTFLSRPDTPSTGEIAYRDLIAQVEVAPESVESVLFIPDRQGIRATLPGGRVVETSYPTEASQLRFQELLERQGVRFDSKDAASDGRPTVAFLALLLAFVAAAIGGQTIVAARKRRRSAALSELRQRLWDDEPDETRAGLTERTRLVFRGIPGRSERLDHRLEDADGVEIGSSLRQPRPRWWEWTNGRPSRSSTVRVEIRDRADEKRVEIVRPSGLLTPPLEVFDESGLVGTIARDGRRRFAVLDAAGVPIGSILRRGRGAAVDYSLTDPAGAEVGTISDFGHIGERAFQPPSSGEKSLLRALGRGQPEEHVLEIGRSVGRTYRILMLGAAAGVYLILQAPSDPP